MAEDATDDLQRRKMLLDIEDLQLRVDRHLRRDDGETQQLLADLRLKTSELAERNRRADPEMEQLLADIRLKNRQSGTEIWKVVLATVVATSVFGGFLLTLIPRLLAQ